MALEQVILYIIIGVLAAIVYSLRILVLMERRIANMEKHVEKLVNKILKEEIKIKTRLKRTKKKK